ncbi:hypothetical protein C9374_011759 [Naegleria lovaniensis]|uniref:Uncharacterized protein n=1 Tax=Naegleria lovaniensis TaxID=51637 RepID=A0AA88GFX9_NAELO|nr:uncharacterized protein C9374_011759 [Naegleria lovaniensis]KAG2373874.1 hypothetical protein C9374_011759 [Naegleria lovaniensis]
MILQQKRRFLVEQLMAQEKLDRLDQEIRNVFISDESVSSRIAMVTNFSWKNSHTKSSDLGVLEAQIEDDLNDPINNVLFAGEDLDFKVLLCTRSLHRLFVLKNSFQDNIGVFQKLTNLDVMDQLKKDDHVIDLSFGSVHTLILTRKGRVFGFGNNQYGQLGQEKEHVFFSKPVSIRINSHENEKVKFHAIHAFGNKSYFVSNIGLFYCGDGNPPQKLQISFPSSAIKMVDGSKDMTVILTASGEMHAMYGTDPIFIHIHPSMHVDSVAVCKLSYIVFLCGQKVFYSLGSTITQIDFELLFKDPSHYVTDIKSSDKTVYFLTSKREIWSNFVTSKPTKILNEPRLPSYYNWHMSLDKNTDRFCAIVKLSPNQKRIVWFWSNLKKSASNQHESFADIVMHTFH